MRDMSRRNKAFLYVASLVALGSALYISDKMYNGVFKETSNADGATRDRALKASVDEQRNRILGRRKKRKKKKKAPTTGAPRTGKPTAAPRTKAPRVKKTRAPRSKKPTKTPTSEAPATKRPKWVFTSRPTRFKRKITPRPTPIPKTARPRTGKPTSAPRTKAPRMTRAPKSTRPTKQPAKPSKQLLREAKANMRKLYLVWLSGYPFTGSQVTLEMIERGSNLSMATNYGDHLADMEGNEYEASYSASIIDQTLFPDGPFFHNVDLPHTSDRLVVKTYCGGTCLPEVDLNCTEHEYIKEAVIFREFSRACRKGRSFKKEKKVLEGARVSGENAIVEVVERRGTKPYNLGNFLKKAIITVRNPLEIVASRFREYAKHDDAYFTNMFNKRGLYKWCNETDTRNMQFDNFKRYETKGFFIKMVERVPCWTEFYRVQYWYNNACKLVKAMDNHILYFEDYVTNLEPTFRGLMNYVGLEVKYNDDLELIFKRTAKHYYWFDPEDQPYIARFMKVIGSPCGWGIMKKYFPPEWFINPEENFVKKMLN